MGDSGGRVCFSPLETWIPACGASATEVSPVGSGCLVDEYLALARVTMPNKIVQDAQAAGLRDKDTGLLLSAQEIDLLTESKKGSSQGETCIQIEEKVNIIKETEKKSFRVEDVADLKKGHWTYEKTGADSEEAGSCGTKCCQKEWQRAIAENSLKNGDLDLQDSASTKDSPSYCQPEVIISSSTSFPVGSLSAIVYSPQSFVPWSIVCIIFPSTLKLHLVSNHF